MLITYQLLVKISITFIDLSIVHVR